MTTGRREVAIPTPINILWENILMLPLIGTLDSKRAQEVMEAVPAKVLETESKTIIVDILGITTVDSKVAAHLVKIIQACKLMGANCIISSISPAIAQTMVHLGIDLGGIYTTASLKDAVMLAFDMTGFEVVKRKATAK